MIMLNILGGKDPREKAAIQDISRVELAAARGARSDAPEQSPRRDHNAAHTVQLADSEGDNAEKLQSFRHGS